MSDGSRLSAPEQVTFYDPFSHYLLADTVRISTLVVGALLVLALAVLAIQRRRRADERGVLVLMALAGCLLAQTSASGVGMGRPPTWWLLDLRILALVISIGAYVGMRREVTRFHGGRKNR